MSNERLYWYVLALVVSIFSAAMLRVIPQELVATIPFLIIGFAIRCHVKPDWRRKP